MRCRLTRESDEPSVKRNRESCRRPAIEDRVVNNRMAYNFVRHQHLLQFHPVAIDPRDVVERTPGRT